MDYLFNYFYPKQEQAEKAEPKQEQEQAERIVYPKK